MHLAARRAVREVSVYLLQLMAVAALASLIWAVSNLFLDHAISVGDPLIVFGWIFLGLVVSDPIRALLRGQLWGSIPPQRRFLRQLAEEQTERLSELRPAEEQAEIVCGAALLGLEARSAALFVCSNNGWVLACASGESVTVDLAVVEEAAISQHSNAPVHLTRLEEIAVGSPMAALARAGVEVLAPVHCGGTTIGCLLIGRARSGIPYGSEHLTFLRGITARAAAALQNGSLLQDLVAAERFATLGRVAAGLAHEIGKPLGVIEHLARRLPERLGDSERVERDMATIASLASEMRATVQNLLGSARRGVAAPAEGGPICAEELFERAISEISRFHGPGRVARRFDPALPELPASAEPLVRVIVNLLDNGLRASASNQVVELRATAGAGELRVEVVDRGSGMSAEVLRRVQHPFFSTRAPGSGTGLGLFLSRRIIETLGGRLVLRSALGLGTHALVCLPLLEGSAPGQKLG